MPSYSWSDVVEGGSYTTTAPTMRSASSSAITLKASSDSSQAAWNLTDLGSGGYGIHVNGGQGNADIALVGIGTDYGTAGGILISVKSSGDGLKTIVNPGGSGAGIYTTGYSALNYPLRIDMYAGSMPIAIVSQLGAAFADGVANGSTTFTSATATFTSGDTGATLTQLTSTATVPSVIPTGTTVTFVNSTTVTLSQAATGSATGINFRLGARVPSNGTPLIQFFPTSAAQILFQSQRTGDTQKRFYVSENGQMNFGAGSATVDLQISRATAGVFGVSGVTNPGIRIGTATTFFSGSGVPGSVANVTDGDLYINTAGGSLTTIYQRRASAWVGIV